VTVTHRVVGPPGCGKTTWLARQCQRGAEKWGPNAALVISLTRAAAREAGGRETGLDPRMVGTLHSHCFRAIGMPKVAESGELLKQWNDEHPQLALSGEDSWDWGDNRGAGSGDGDRMLSELSMRRQRMDPREKWPELVSEFSVLWEDYKKQTSSVDFCDMIERAIDEVPTPPGAPQVIFADEAQDLSRLELKLLERWCQSCEHLTLVYDPAQALYAWRGADASMAQVEPSIILKQSYRVPRSVQEHALSVIRNSSTYREAEYLPRDEEGAVRREQWTLRRPEAWVETLDDPFAGTTMVLASCSYMLEPLIREMRRLGIPYHNPYSPARWNPLRAGFTRKTATDRLRAFLDFSEKEYLTASELDLLSTSLKKSGIQLKGAKEAIGKLPEVPEIPDLVRCYKEVFTGSAIEALYAQDLDWYRDSLLSGNARSAEFPIAVYKRLGLRQFVEVTESDKPVPGCVVVGTIHSVKGGECDRVILFPDMSRAGIRSMDRPGWLHRDGVWRMFYVGCTRARSELVIGEPCASNLSCQL